MDTAIEQFYQPVIRQTCIGLEKHEGHFTLRREQMFLALLVFLWEDIYQFFCQFLEWKLSMDASELTQFETLQIFLLKIEFSKWQRWLYFRYFL